MTQRLDPSLEHRRPLPEHHPRFLEHRRPGPSKHGWSRSARAIVCLGLAFGCGDDSKEAASSAIFVQVTDSRGALVQDAEVSTEPETEAGATDETGTVLIEHVRPGFYKVSAVHGVNGAASRALRVEKDELVRVSLVLESPRAVGTGGTGAQGPGASGGRSSGTGGRAVGGGGSGAGRAGAGASAASAGATAGLEFIDAATQVEAMLVDPSRPYLYALDRVNNSLLFVNLESRSVEKTIFVGSSPVDMDFDDTASELYIANFGSTEISVVDLEAQEIARTMFVDISQGTWEGNPYRLIVSAENTLIFTQEDQWCDLKLVNAVNGGHIAVVGSLREPDLLATADGNTIFVGESGGQLHRFELADSTLTEVDVSTDGGTRMLVMSGDERFIFHGGRKILTSNLKNVLGQFSETIYATNADGSIAVGSSRVFDGTDFSIIRPLPLTTTTMAISPDYATLYLYELTSSRIYVYDLASL